MTNPKYPVYIVSKGRHDSMITSKSLSRMKVPHYIVIEPQDEADYENRIHEALTNAGPWLIAARTDNKSPDVETERDPALIRDRFMRGLGVKPSM